MSRGRRMRRGSARPAAPQQKLYPGWKVGDRWGPGVNDVIGAPLPAAIAPPAHGQPTTPPPPTGRISAGGASGRGAKGSPIAGMDRPPTGKPSSGSGNAAINKRRRGGP